MNVVADGCSVASQMFRAIMFRATSKKVAFSTLLERYDSGVHLGAELDRYHVLKTDPAVQQQAVSFEQDSHHRFFDRQSQQGTPQSFKC